MRQHWHVFDARCMVGRHVTWQAGAPHSVRDLLAEMDHYAITEALVWDCLGIEHHPAEGNRRVRQLTSGQRRLWPVWTALPAAGHNEQPPPTEFLAALRRQRVAAVALFPRQFRFSLADWCVDAFLEPLAAARVPVFICPNEFGSGRGWQQDATDWPELVALCRRWPNLPVILTEFRIRQTQRMAYRALDACPNLRLELSGYWLHRGIEYITATCGAERLIFGSNWPRFGPHMTLATLTTADIAEAVKLRIAGDNLRALLAWNEPAIAAHQLRAAEVRFPPAPDPWVQFGRTGRRPRTMRFQDCHGHLGETAPHYHLSGCTLPEIVADLKRLGVERNCVFAFTGVQSDEQPGNTFVAGAVRRYPRQFVGFTLVNPHRGAAAMRRELTRGARLGLRGVKLIPYYQGYPDEGPLIEVASQWAHERRQIILNHYWGSPRHLERLVSRYPNACFITGHCTTEYADLMRRYPNIYVCSCPLLGPRACEEVVAQIGADRLLFGSDLEDLPIAWGLGPILFARLPARDKRLILGGNLARLLRTYSLRP